MRKHTPLHRPQTGVMLIEALIAILIFSIGILAVVGMQGTAIKNVTQSKSRSDAAMLANQLIAQMWADKGNIAQYNYPGSGTIPAKLGTLSPTPTGWIGQVSKLPGATTALPVITVPAPGAPAATASGATVQIQIFWQMPEEVSLGLPPHDYTVIVSIFL
ncbi:MAG TPA: type IV pilus modification protein PilV [Burkholderiales bacterium]|nr:type IV pilus modification protein PilV [Burkholderiales bacterium]